MTCANYSGIGNCPCCPFCLQNQVFFISIDLVSPVFYRTHPIPPITITSHCDFFRWLHFSWFYFLSSAVSARLNHSPVSWISLLSSHWLGFNSPNSYHPVSLSVRGVEWFWVSSPNYVSVLCQKDYLFPLLCEYLGVCSYTFTSLTWCEVFNSDRVQSQSRTQSNQLLTCYFLWLFFSSSHLEFLAIRCPFVSGII